MEDTVGAVEVWDSRDRVEDVERDLGRCRPLSRDLSRLDLERDLSRIWGVLLNIATGGGRRGRVCG